MVNISSSLIYQNGLQALCDFLKLGDGFPKSAESPTDGVIVAIDFENVNAIKRGFCKSDANTQMGIAKLDMRELSSKPLSSQPIITFNYATGSLEYNNEASSNFLFGESVLCEPSKLICHVYSAIPDDRLIILVGHAVRNELEALEALGFTGKVKPFASSTPFKSPERYLGPGRELWASS